MAKKALRLDEIGYWSEIKLEIVRKYASAYYTILSRKEFIKGHLYIDAFAGAGTHVSKRTGDPVLGSPRNAMDIQPPFSELHFIDMDGTRAAELRRLAADDGRISVHKGDCNRILLEKVFPRCEYRDYRRGLCLLDPYGLKVNWEVLAKAGQMRTVEIFYNFMMMDANMNVFMKDPSNVAADQAARMDAVWGDGTWRSAVYRPAPTLFGDVEEKVTNEEIAEAFRQRLRDVAGFAYVPSPMPMRNSRGAIVYYLYFASPDATGGKIVTQIFDRYRSRGVR